MALFDSIGSYSGLFDGVPEGAREVVAERRGVRPSSAMQVGKVGSDVGPRGPRQDTEKPPPAQGTTICDWECFNNNTIGPSEWLSCLNICLADPLGRTCVSNCFYRCNEATGECFVSAWCMHPDDCLPAEEPQ